MFRIALIIAFSAVLAAEAGQVYKWVDEDGNVHYSDQPPSQEQDAEELKLESSPIGDDANEAQERTDRLEAKHQTSRDQRSAAREEKRLQRELELEMPAAAQVDISAMTLAELDQRCEDAREEKIAPLREAEIASCKQDRRNDPAFCESFNADFGDGGRTASGAIRPRMFDDLPECAEALHEQNTRRR